MRNTVVGYSWSIKHSRWVGTARGCGRNPGKFRSACTSHRGLRSPQSGGGCSGNCCPAWPGGARTFQSHSGDLARSFSWKGSSCRHCPRLCSSRAGSSTALTAASSGLGLLLGARPHRVVTQRPPKATSSTRPATRAAPTSMSAWRRKVLIPAREKPQAHPSAHCAHKVPHISSGKFSMAPATLQEPSHLPPGQSTSPKPTSQGNT